MDSNPESILKIKSKHATAVSAFNDKQSQSNFKIK